MLKSFNYHEIPATLLVIFCPGGLDFVGGYTYYRWLENNLPHLTHETSSLSTTELHLGKVELREKSGEEVHATLFESGSVKYPTYWK